jgi:hypothetical protein
MPRGICWWSRFSSRGPARRRTSDDKTEKRVRRRAALKNWEGIVTRDA